MERRPKFLNRNHEISTAQQVVDSGLYPILERILEEKQGQSGAGVRYLIREKMRDEGKIRPDDKGLLLENETD